jgi:hypothetical protein
VHWFQINSRDARSFSRGAYLVLDDVHDDIDEEDDLLFVGAHEWALQPGGGHVQHAYMVGPDHVEAFDAHLVPLEDGVNNNTSCWRNGL